MICKNSSSACLVSTTEPTSRKSCDISSACAQVKTDHCVHVLSALTIRLDESKQLTADESAATVGNNRCSPRSPDLPKMLSISAWQRLNSDLKLCKNKQRPDSKTKQAMCKQAAQLHNYLQRATLSCLSVSAHTVHAQPVEVFGGNGFACACTDTSFCTGQALATWQKYA